MKDTQKKDTEVGVKVEKKQNKVIKEVKYIGKYEYQS